MVRRLGAVSAIVALLLSMMGAAVASAYHEGDGEVHPWADERFEDRWARADLPVSEGEAVRTWIWGPSPYTEGMMQPYAESPGGERLVQYTDKSRMELNDPTIDNDSIWVVTQGLLAWEMMTGQFQVGDAEHVDHSEGASTENVAGDPGADNGPTYATMGMMMDAEARAEGTPITERLALDGTVTTDAGLAAYGVTAAENVQVEGIDHTIASVFWDFMNSQGVIWDGDEYDTGYLFADPDGTLQPFYAVGYPLTEAYWTTVRVLNTPMDVLVQCFERRCLTYTPGNPVGWQVEAGNVGQHHFRWMETHDDTPPPPPFDELITGLINPRGVDVHDGSVYIAESGTGGETNCVMVGEEPEEQAMEVCVGFTGRVSVWNEATGHTVLADDLPSIGVMGEGSGPNDVFVTDDGRVFVVIGLGGMPDVRGEFADDEGQYLGWIVEVHEDGTWTPVVDVAVHENSNPDEGIIDSNPYSLVVIEDGFVVTDAGGNSLVKITQDGDDWIYETLAVFPPVSGFDPVPTGLALGEDGAYYVGTLVGGPSPDGAASVWRVVEGSGPEVYKGGFTSIGDVAFDNDGDLLVLEIVAGGFVNAETDPRGQLIHVEAGTLDETVLLHDGLVFSTGVAAGADDTIYITNFSVMPNAQLIAFESPLP